VPDFQTKEANFLILGERFKLSAFLYGVIGLSACPT